MDRDYFLRPITVEEFNKHTNHAYPPDTRFYASQEHWADRRDKLLGVITLDQIDHDYGYVMLGRYEQRSNSNARAAACEVLVGRGRLMICFLNNHSCHCDPADERLRPCALAKRVVCGAR